MPRKSRIDAPGALHHIIARGIDRRKIFKSDEDRDHFISRFGDILKETKTQCYGWALIPNHFHFLLKTGIVPISTTMKRILTGYAMWHNRKCRGYGYLFQNRYKPVLCQKERKYELHARCFTLSKVTDRVAEVLGVEQADSEYEIRRLLAEPTG